jgi:hypothetical protein
VKNPTPTRLHSPETVRWVNDGGVILVVDERRQSCHRLEGEEAAVWSWLTLSYSTEKISALLSAAKGISPAEAEESLGRILRKWSDAELLAPDGGENG